MSNLYLIAAIGKNNELGKNNSLIWYLPDDLKFFKEKTMEKTIVMGYNTFKSLKKCLPNRKHIVLTSKNIDIPGVSVYHNFMNLLNDLKKTSEDVYIIGGASIYKQFINEVQTMYLTEVNATDDQADTFFPYFDKNDWVQTELASNENNGIKFKHMEYKKKGI